MNEQATFTKWAVILGASSGFGEACALALAESGMHIIGVHLDRRATLGKVESIVASIEAKGQKAIFFNTNAASHEKRKEILEQVQEAVGAGSMVKVLIHSLAFGTLKPYISDNPKLAINQSQMEMTLDVMANSLVYWVQDLVNHKLLVNGSRIYALTSAGSHRVVPNYGAVSAAKAALESHIRQLATELAPLGITANGIRAGITDTPALRKIPGYEDLIGGASANNPSGRMTTPKDVADAIVTLATGTTHWITGDVIGVDGGEDITGF